MKVGVVLPAAIGDAGDYLANARALDAAGAEMIQVEGGVEVQLVILGAIAAVTERIKLLTPARAESLDRLSRGRALVELPAGEKWEFIPMPPNRESWASTMREHEASGTAGVVVPWDERLIDLLRNPEPEDRSDLLMSTG